MIGTPSVALLLVPLPEGQFFLVTFLKTEEFKTLAE